MQLTAWPWLRLCCLIFTSQYISLNSWIDKFSCLILYFCFINIQAAWTSWADFVYAACTGYTFFDMHEFVNKAKLPCTIKISSACWRIVWGCCWCSFRTNLHVIVQHAVKWRICLLKKLVVDKIWYFCRICAIYIACTHSSYQPGV